MVDGVVDVSRGRPGPASHKWTTKQRPPNADRLSWFSAFMLNHSGSLTSSRASLKIRANFVLTSDEIAGSHRQALEALKDDIAHTFQHMPVV